MNTPRDELTDRELDRIADQLALRVAERLAGPLDAIVRRAVGIRDREANGGSGILPMRLTVPQFAACIQRCAPVVRGYIRARNIVADGPPYLIHPRELAKFHVDPSMALERLRNAGLADQPSDVGLMPASCQTV